jgi:ubiquinone/menaquinone biosynthesis C-methylase UbiE
MTPHGFLRRLHGHRHAEGSGHTVFTGRKAASYDRASGWAMRPLYRAVARTVVDDLPPGGRLLDVGTGPGRLLVEIARRRPDAHLTGVDPSADMVAYAREHAQASGLGDTVAAQVAGAENLPFADQTFDVVVSSLSAHHWADRTRAVAEQARVLKPGGQLWVCDLHGSTISDELATAFHPADVTRPQLRGLARLFLGCHRAIRSTIPR